MIAFLALTTLLQGPAPPIPDDVARLLSAAYPGWRLSEVDRERHPEGNITNVFRGDFDGDGLRDYALLIDYHTQPHGATSIRFKRAVVVLRHRGGAQLTPLTDPIKFEVAPRLHLAAVPKGTRGMDLNDYRRFVYERDAIMLASEACRTFIYRGGKFVSIWTCD
jgi:hypothetical protein